MWIGPCGAGWLGAFSRTLLESWAVHHAVCSRDGIAEGEVSVSSHWSDVGHLELY